MPAQGAKVSTATVPVTGSFTDDTTIMKTRLKAELTRAISFILDTLTANISWERLNGS
jgi:hypothetical protein